MTNEVKNPFGLSDKELDNEVKCLKDSMFCELSGDYCDYDSLMRYSEELEALGEDIFSLL